MLTGRSYGGMPVMSTPSMKMRPVVGSSKPASMRSSVVLPQPEPPSRQNSSPLIDLQRDVVDGDEVAELLRDAARCGCRASACGSFQGCDSSAGGRLIVVAAMRLRQLTAAVAMPGRAAIAFLLPGLELGPHARHQAREVLAVGQRAGTASPSLPASDRCPDRSSLRRSRSRATPRCRWRSSRSWNCWPRPAAPSGS